MNVFFSLRHRAAAIAILAAVALFVFKRSVIEVIMWGASLGLIMGLFATFVA